VLGGICLPISTENPARGQGTLKIGLFSDDYFFRKNPGAAESGAATTRSAINHHSSYVDFLILLEIQPSNLLCQITGCHDPVCAMVSAERRNHEKNHVFSFLLRQILHTPILVKIAHLIVTPLFRLCDFHLCPYAAHPA
jgi:hypothetical protein